MFRLNLRQRRAPSLRDDSIDWNTVIDRARTAVQTGKELESAFDQLAQAVNSFVEQTKADARQLLNQVEALRASAQAQNEAFDDIETDMYGEDDVPDELNDLYSEINNGDYDSELDDLDNALTDIAG
jgi:replication-associated recombination protein RarA